MKVAVIHKIHPGVVVDRWEFEALDADDVDDQVSRTLDGVIWAVGDTLEIVRDDTPILQA